MSLCKNKKEDPIIENVSTKRLRRMFNYFKGEKVYIRYHYWNSIGVDWVREYSGKYDDFEIRKDEYCGGCSWNILLKKKDKVVFEQDFEDIAEFYGLGKIRQNTSGPLCTFSIANNSLLKKFSSFLVKKYRKFLYPYVRIPKG